MGSKWHMGRRTSRLYWRGTGNKAMFLWGNQIKKTRHWIIRQLDQIYLVNSKKQDKNSGHPLMSLQYGPFSKLELTKQPSDLLLFQSQYREQKQSSTSSIEPGNNKNTYEITE